MIAKEERAPLTGGGTDPAKGPYAIQVAIANHLMKNASI